jgi:hypothetical protein
LSVFGSWIAAVVSAQIWSMPEYGGRLLPPDHAMGFPTSNLYPKMLIKGART